MRISDWSSDVCSSDLRLPAGPVVVYDDEGYLMGGVLAELIAKAGHDVTLVTPAALVSAWTLKALDQPFVHRRLVDCGVTLRLNSLLTACRAARVEPACAYTGARSEEHTSELQSLLRISYAV